MNESLHDQFQHSGHAAPVSPHYHHPDSDSIIKHSRERLYALPAGRRLVDTLNLHRIPVTVEHAKQTGYRVENNRAIILTCPLKFETPIYEMAIHLGCAIRRVELHIHQYMSPEIKDSMQYLGTQFSEIFEIALLICKLAYDLNPDDKNAQIREFIDRENYTELYEAFKKNTPYKEMEDLLSRVNAEKSKTDG